MYRKKVDATLINTQRIYCYAFREQKYKATFNKRRYEQLTLLDSVKMY